ncbi:hypothetical protein MWH28_09690 [Natroniella sulfidigena]|uniref:hypothetical protein n=1 Tax=Natroniella sulfidigena TaxID=723921 RepID=UPI00200B9FDE|nr:hypothetical protein [Natroniella sulfidigena]MCK8817629.1 hypothetical protein [Natroniella sulfidigena]
MKKRTKILVIVFLVMGVGILIVNSYLGNVIAEQIEARIEVEAKEAAVPTEVEYANLEVNPLLSKVVFNEFIIKDDQEEVSFEELQIKIPKSDLSKAIQAGSLNNPNFKEISSLDFELANLKINSTIAEFEKMLIEQLNFKFTGQFIEEELQKLEALDLELAELVIDLGRDDEQLVLGEFKLQFDGLLKQRMEEEPELLVEYDQSLKLASDDFKIDAIRLFEELLFSAETGAKLTTIDNLVMDISYDSSKQELNFREAKLDTPILTTDYSNTYQFSGDSLEEFELTTIAGEGYLELETGRLEWGDSNLTGKYSVDDFSVMAEYDAVTDYSGLSDGEFDNIFEGQGETNILVEGFEVELAGMLREQLEHHPAVFMFGLDLDDFRIELLDLASSYQEQNMKSSTKLNSSLLDLDVAADFEIAKDDFEESNFNKLKAEVSNLAPNLQLLVMGLEAELGTMLPREGDNLFFEYVGPLKDLQVENFRNEEI